MLISRPRPGPRVTEYKCDFNLHPPHQKKRQKKKHLPKSGFMIKHFNSIYTFNGVKIHLCRKCMDNTIVSSDTAYKVVFILNDLLEYLTDTKYNVYK